MIITVTLNAGLTLPASDPVNVNRNLLALLGVPGVVITLEAADIPNDSINTARLQNASVTTAKLVDANVTTAKLADSSVTTAKLVDASVTTAKLADASVTTAKLQSVAANKILGTYDSGWMASGITSSLTTMSYPHGLSDYPGIVEVWFRWGSNPPTSYAVNEAVNWHSLYTGIYGYPMILSSDATNVILSFASAVTQTLILKKAILEAVTANLTTAQIRIVARLTAQTGV